MINLDPQYCLDTFREDDYKSLAEAMNNKAVLDQLLQLPNPYSQEDAALFIRQNLNYYNAEGEHLNRCIRFKADDTIVGGIGHKLPVDDYLGHTTEIGYWVKEEQWGKGIATRAVKAFTSYLFKEKNYLRVYAYCFSENPASARVLEKAGFEREGLLRKLIRKNTSYKDCILYACLNSANGQD